MSSIYIANIVGANDFAVPTTDAELVTTTAALRALLVAGLASLQYPDDGIQAWVVHPVGGGAPALACQIQPFQFNGEQNPDQSEVSNMRTAIEGVLLADPDINTVGDIDVTCWTNVSYWPWSIDANGALAPAVTPAAVFGVMHWANVQIQGSITTSAWTDMDLSTLFGEGGPARQIRAKVWIHFQRDTTGDPTCLIAVREKGQVHEPRLQAGEPGGCAFGYLPIAAGNDTVLELTCTTNTQGICEYYCQCSAITGNIELWCWIPAQDAP
jgi:hypothetical protein